MNIVKRARIVLLEEGVAGIARRILRKTFLGVLFGWMYRLYAWRLPISSRRAALLSSYEIGKRTSLRKEEQGYEGIFPEFGERGLDLIEYETYRQIRAKELLSSLEDNSHKKSEVLLQCNFILVRESSPGDGSGIDDRIQATLDSIGQIEGLQQAEQKVYLLDGSKEKPRDDQTACDRINDLSDLRKIANAMPDSIFVILKAGDKVQTDFAKLLRLYGIDSWKLVFFDLFIRESGTIYLQILPGFDHVLFRHFRYTLDRYAIGATILLQNLQRSATDIENAPLVEMVKVDRWRKIHSRVHIPLPLIELHMPKGRMKEDSQRYIQSLEISTAPDGQGRKTVGIVIRAGRSASALQKVVRSTERQRSGLVNGTTIIAGKTEDKAALEYLDYLSRIGTLEVIEWSGSESLSAEFNAGARIVKGDFILFLDENSIPLSENWIEQLLLTLDTRTGGVCGPLILQKEGLVQSAGMSLCGRSLIEHLHKGSRYEASSFTYRYPRLVDSVASAMLLTRRDIFERLNGFDLRLGTCLLNADYCLRTIDIGWDVIFDPRVVFQNISPSPNEANQAQMASRITEELEMELFRRKWPEIESLHQSKQALIAIYG